MYKTMYKTTNTIYVVSRTNNPDELLHYGIKGMKWGKLMPWN